MLPDEKRDQKILLGDAGPRLLRDLILEALNAVALLPTTK